MRAILALGVGILVTAGVVTGGDAKDDLAKLQGTWTAPHLGKKAVFQIEKDAFTLIMPELVLADDGASATYKEMTFKGTVRIDGSKKPKIMDLKVTDGKKYKGETALGIYEIKGETLKWCVNEPGREGRPKEFAKEDGEKHYLFLEFKLEKGK